MKVTPSKIAAIVVALGYLATSLAIGGWDTEGLPIVCLLLALPLTFIWFPDFFHEHLGRANSRFTNETPAFMFVVVGWLWLVGYLPLLMYLLARTAQ
jgi:hypothetical protein